MNRSLQLPKQLLHTNAQRTRGTTRTFAMANSNFANFADSKATEFSVCIVGDLHLPKTPTPMPLFEEARNQLTSLISDSPAPRIVQLGDLGSYEKGWPGSRACFNRSLDYLNSFELPVGMVLGNHDLEADEFETDEENLQVWQDIFQRKHYWSAELGPAIFIGLSTTRFRSNPYSVHEVHISDDQIEFLETTLKQANGRPVVIYTHAPPLGSGLKVMQTVHVKNRCAWLNHSSNPRKFMEIVKANPNIKLWFSGHFHLSQSYPNSISIVGSTAFCLTGVIGDNSTKDGHRHSRLLKGTSKGFELYTVDHDNAGSLRLDLRGSWEGTSPPEYLVPEEELICDVSAGWLCSKIDCTVDWEDDGSATDVISHPEGLPANLTWFNSGAGSMVALVETLLVEYDVESMAPIGAVFLDVPETATVRMLDAAGRVVDGMNGDGSDAVVLQLVDRETGEVLQETSRNERGQFYQVFQKNKWVARKEKEAAERALSAV